MTTNFTLILVFATFVLIVCVWDMVEDYKKVDSIVAFIESHLVVRVPILFIAYFGVLYKAAEWFYVFPPRV